HPLAIETLRPFGERTPREGRVELGDHLAAMAAALACGCEAWIGEQILALHAARDAGEMAVGFEADQPKPAAPPGAITIDERRLALRARDRGSSLSKGELNAEVPAETIGARSQQRGLDDPASSRALPFVERRDDPGDGRDGGHVIAEAAADLRRCRALG